MTIGIEQICLGSQNKFVLFCWTPNIFLKLRNFDLPIFPLFTWKKTNKRSLRAKWFWVRRVFIYVVIMFYVPRDGVSEMMIKLTCQQGKWICFFCVVPLRHYGSKQPDFPALIIHFPTSSGVSECASKRVSAEEHVSEASSAEQSNEWIRSCSLTLLTPSIAPHCLLRSRAPLRSFNRSLAPLESLPSSWGSQWFDGYFCCVSFFSSVP